MERVIFVRLKAKYRNISLINVYAPTEDADIEAKNNFRDTVEALLRDVNRSDLVMLMEDLNPRVGGKNADYREIADKHSLGPRNDGIY